MNDRPDSVCSTCFRNPPAKCGEWLTLMRNGSIEAESYDHSDLARASLGSDVAFILTLDYSSVRRLLSVIEPAEYDPGFAAISPFTLWPITQRCANYQELKELCDANGIPYSLVFDSYA